MAYEPSGPFITSTLELKLDANTLFEWHKYSQDLTVVPHYRRLLEFINVSAQACDTSVPDSQRSSVQHGKRTPSLSKPVASFVANATETTTNFVLCKTDRHPLLCLFLCLFSFQVFIA